VIFEPTGEMQDDDRNCNQVKQGKQNIGQRVVPLSIGSLAVIILFSPRSESHPGRPTAPVHRSPDWARPP
jgi:hypothetical protein